MRGLTPAVAMRLFHETTLKWWDDDAPHLGAALAFYAVLSIAPLAVVAVTWMGMMVGPETAQTLFVKELQSLIGREGASAFQAMMRAASTAPRGGTITTIAGILTLLVGATGVLGELQNALNRIWDVKRPLQNWRQVVHRRFFSLGIVMVFGFLLLISLVITALLNASGAYMERRIPGYSYVLHTVNLIVTFFVVTAIFGMTFKMLPDTRVAWRDVWVGACLTAFMFTIGKFLIGLYIGRSTVATVYGAAGSIVILLLWVYYSSQILFFGAEFTRVYARHHVLPDGTPKIDGKPIPAVAPEVTLVEPPASAAPAGIRT